MPKDLVRYDIKACVTCENDSTLGHHPYCARYIGGDIHGCMRPMENGEFVLASDLEKKTEEEL